MGVMSGVSRTVRRVCGCKANRDRYVIARGSRTTGRFVSEISTTTICHGTDAHFASNNRFNFKTRVNVSARGLRTENPLNLPRLASFGCRVFKGNRVEWIEEIEVSRTGMGGGHGGQ